jgi:hypothetical protein
MSSSPAGERSPTRDGRSSVVPPRVAVMSAKCSPRWIGKTPSPLSNPEERVDFAPGEQRPPQLGAAVIGEQA